MGGAGLNAEWGCAANKMNEIAFLVFFFLCGLRAAAAALLRKEKTNEDKKKSN